MWGMRWIVKQAGQEWRRVWFNVCGVTYELAWREHLPQLKLFILHHLDSTHNLQSRGVEILPNLLQNILGHVPCYAYIISVQLDY